MSECIEYAGATVCREQTVEVRREPDGEPRWCFACRKRCEFVFVVREPVGMSYYGPTPSVRCAACGATDGDMFPGGYREWE